VQVFAGAAKATSAMLHIVITNLAVLKTSKKTQQTISIIIINIPSLQTTDSSGHIRFLLYSFTVFPLLAVGSTR